MTTQATTRPPLPRMLAGPPDPTLTLPQARAAVNLLRWRDSLSLLLRRHDQLGADQQLKNNVREARTTQLMDSIKVLVAQEVSGTERLQLPGRQPEFIVEIAHHYLEALILAAHRCSSRGTSVEDLLLYWLEEQEHDTAIAALDGQSHARILRDLEARPRWIRHAVASLAAAWLAGNHPGAGVGV